MRCCLDAVNSSFSCLSLVKPPPDLVITMKQSTKLYIALHLFLMFYSVSGVVSKLAAGKPFLSPAFIALYGIEILILGVYAIGWQQFIKRMPLSVAYANKAVTVVWGCVWGVLIFREQLTPGKIIGALLVLCGVALYGWADGKAAKE